MNIQSRVIPSWDVTREPEKYVKHDFSDIRKTFQKERAKLACKTLTPDLSALLRASIEQAKAKRGNK